MSALNLRTIFAQFAPVSDALWAALAPHLQEELLPKGAHWLQPGQPATHLALVTEGGMRQYYVVDGDERTVYFGLEGSLVCAYSSYLTHQPCPYYLQAMEPCRLTTLSLQVLREAEAQYPELGEVFRRLAEYLFINLELRLHNQLLLSPEDRYLQLLAHPPTCLLEGGPPVWERIPQKYLASFLGITPVSFSRIRARVAAQKS